MIKHLKAFYHQTLLTRLNVIAAFAHKRVKENTSKGRAVAGRWRYCTQPHKSLLFPPHKSICGILSPAHKRQTVNSL